LIKFQEVASPLFRVRAEADTSEESNFKRFGQSRVQISQRKLMIQIRLRPLCRGEFDRSTYKPGVISLSRLLWGSVGAGGSLLCIALFSGACDVGVLYPPLAATCFINATCVYLRVARPKQIIVGHFVSAVAGVLAVLIVTALVSKPILLVPLKLGLAVTLAAVFMQVFDADHPPAAATAAIPAVLPLPVSSLLLPLHMAWGAVIAVLYSMAWSSPWFHYPPPEDTSSPLYLGMYMEKSEALGLGFCTLAFILMALKPLSLRSYHVGLGTMLLGLVVLMMQHFFAAELIMQDSPTLKEGEAPATDDARVVRRIDSFRK
jgi:HPP family